MNRGRVIADVQRQFGPLSEREEELVETVLRLTIRSDWEGPLPKPPEEPIEFQGENPCCEEIERFTLQERGQLMTSLRARNRKWLEKKCEELRAGWIMVIDGKVVAHGPTLANYPSDEWIEKLCNEAGKVPLLYVRPTLMAVEEGTPWHVTTYAMDKYPTLSITLSGNGASVNLIGDFDTGSSNVFTDFDLLEKRGIIRVGKREPSYFDSHLGQWFECVIKSLKVALTSTDGTVKETLLGVVCILDWANSPFVAINPNRTALVGRDLCLQLQPKVMLDFAQSETTLTW